jgi:hypothetical protein
MFTQVDGWLYVGHNGKLTAAKYKGVIKVINSKNNTVPVHVDLQHCHDGHDGTHRRSRY